MIKLKRAHADKKPYTDFETLPFMLNAHDIALMLRISKAGAYNLVNSEGFPKIMVGKRVLVPKDDLLQWIQQKKR